jgi:hypothetical protein
VSDDSTAVLHGQLVWAGCADGREHRLRVVVTKGDPAWLVDWPATRESWE